MQLLIEDDRLEVRLARWEKILGLMRNICVPLRDVSEVEVLEKPMRETMRSGIKVGLRVPWLCYVARSIRLDQVFVVRRGAPGLSFAVSGHGALRRVLVSTPQAAELAQRLRSGG